MLQKQDLVRVTAYSNKIKELPVYKRISIDYPLLCRDDVAKRIAKAADLLPSNLILQVDSAYRTRKTQENIWKRRNKEGLKIVFNPEDGIPPHCTGGAIDVSLLDEDGVEINLSKPYAKYYDEPKLKSDKIAKEAQEKRLLLNKVMLDNGFAPNPREYWHFSYGDKDWADYYNKNILYEEISLSKNYYYPLFKRLLYRVILRLRFF